MKQIEGNLLRQILTFLLFDPKYGVIIRNRVSLQFWQADKNVYQLVEKVYRYIDLYKTVPRHHSFEDLIPELKLPKEDQEMLEGLVAECESDFTTHSYTPERVLSSLENFCKYQKYQQLIADGQKLLEAGDLDKLSSLILSATKDHLVDFDPGSKLSSALLNFQESPTRPLRDRVFMRVHDLDIRSLVPTRKELWLIAAPPKSSKSWALVHAGMCGMIDGLRVLHITLEMSEELTKKRYLQTMMGASFDEFPMQVPRVFITPINLTPYTPPPAKSFHEDLVQFSAMNKLKRLDDFLLVKEFPTGQLSFHGLKAFLDTLEIQNNFVPDLLIIDYADLMRLDMQTHKDSRVALGQLYKDLRGLAVERNIMLATASQINRAGAQSDEVDISHLSEDFSKAMTADTVLILSRSKFERENNLAKLFVAAGRNAEDKFTILLEQDLGAGLWALSSNRLTSTLRDEYNRLKDI